MIIEEGQTYLTSKGLVHVRAIQHFGTEVLAFIYLEGKAMYVRLSSLESAINKVENIPNSKKAYLFVSEGFS